MRYYISDLHFYHENLNYQMDHRGFLNAAEMNAHMIHQWNSRIRDKDEVVVLGDLSLGTGEETNGILRQLRGRICLIEGNHDSYLTDRQFDRSRLEWVKPYAELRDNKRKVILSHYPMICYNGQYRKDEEGRPRAYMLYGHVHDTFDEALVNRYQDETRRAQRPDCHGGPPLSVPCQMINCFCMFSDYIPLTLDEWIEEDEKRRSGITDHISFRAE
jgi:calcineurin-like phosphoesterase family protein